MMINFDSIDMSNKIFEFNAKCQKKFNKLIRKDAFLTAIECNENMIYVVSTDFNDKNEYKSLLQLKKAFEKTGGNFYFVELFSNIDVRISKNKEESNLLWKKEELLNLEKKYRLNSFENEFWFLNHYKIDNEKISSFDVAKMICEKFNLKIETKLEDKNKIY